LGIVGVLGGEGGGNPGALQAALEWEFRRCGLVRKDNAHNNVVPHGPSSRDPQELIQCRTHHEGLAPVAEYITTRC
jgi:hypothetical protein